MRHDSISGRNFGYGKMMEYAGKNALRDCYNGGHHATVAAHTERWGKFTQFSRDNGIRDMRDVSRETVEKFADSLREKVSLGNMEISYAQNLISSVNTVLSFVREDKNCYISPSQAVGGERISVRQEPPLSLDRERVEAAAAALREAGHERGAVALEAGRELGLRLKESLLLDYKGALREATETGKISVSEGTKGGRGHTLPREIPATPENRAVLERGATLQEALGGKNLIGEGENLKTVFAGLRGARDLIKAEGLRGFHDGRAAYACDRYHQLTGYSAPVVAGERTADRATDRAARETIAQELGHGRASVVSAYIGSSR